MSLLTVALSNLRRRKARAAFLIVGLLIGVCTVVALVSLTQSLTGQTRADLQSFGANIVITPKSRDVALSYGGMSFGGLALGEQAIAQADLARIDAIPSREDVSVVAPELAGAVRVDGRRVLLLGVDLDRQFKLKRWWSVGAGRAPTNDRELIAGAAAARTLGLLMGDYVRIAGERFTVTGVLRETGSQDDSLLITDLGAAQRILGRPDTVSLVEVAALYAGSPVQRIADEIQAALPGTTVTALQEAVKSREHAVEQFTKFTYAIVGVVVAIEALVVFLTVMGSVSARTHEIGVFRAIGFRRAHITRLILIEALVAGALAGVLGYVAGMGTAFAVVPLVARSAEVVWAPLVGVTAVAAAIGIGGLASLYPALRAGKLDPTEALRAL